MRSISLAAIAVLMGAFVLSGCGGGGTPGTGSNNLSVRSNPSGARIFLDGQDTGRTTPADLSVSAESGVGTEHQITLTLSGYAPWGTLATVSASDVSALNISAEMTPTTAATGTITTASTPVGARIFDNGTDTGRVTPATLTVPASQHVLEFRLDGYHSYREEVVVAPGGAMTSAPVLTRQGNGIVTGRVLDSEGSGLIGATVTVRGTSVTTQTTTAGIFTLSNVPAGTHTLDATSAGTPAYQGTLEGVVVLNGRMTSNADIVTAAGGATGTVTGQVVDGRGEGIAGAEVFASQALPPNQAPDPSVAPRRAEADASGNYTLRSLPPGAWVFTAVYPQLATVSHGISPTLYVVAGQTTRVDFELPGSTSGKPSAPMRLEATAFTLPASTSRAPATAYQAVKDRLLAKSGSKRSASLSRLQERDTRSAPAGSLIEVDVSWIAPSSPDVIGYFLWRSTQPDGGFSIIQDLLSPHAGLWIDYDQRLAPGRAFYYRADAVNSRGIHSDPSNVAETRPLGQIVAAGPTGANASASPLFTWQTLPGAGIYTVQLYDRVPDRNILPVWESELAYAPATSINYDGAPLQAGRTYYWIVAGANSANPEGITGWSISPFRSFTVGN